MGNGSSKTLVILDLNHVLCRMVHKKKDKKARSGNVHMRKQDALIRNTYCLYKRPGLEELLEYLFESDEFEVAVWSSRLNINTKPVIKELFGSYANDLLFKFHREMTNDNGKGGIIKNLETIWSMEECASFRDSTVIIDTDIDTIRYQKENAIIVPAYENENDPDNVLFYLKSYINERPEKSFEDYCNYDIIGKEEIPLVEAEAVIVTEEAEAVIVTKEPEEVEDSSENIVSKDAEV